MTSIVFPGQGSQSVGMSKDFNDNFKIAKQIFEEIEDYTQLNIRKLIFENEENKLNLTQLQICIASSYVIFQTYISENDLSIENFKVMMGHSLGEYTALACSKKINLKECCLILKKRGELMNNAIAPNKTGMVALIGKDSNFIQKIINDNQLDLEISNDNSPMQIVLSGLQNEIKKNKDLFLSYGVKKYVELNVSAAFHSKFMLEAQRQLKGNINNLHFNDNKIFIISNYDAEAYNDSNLIKKNLQMQMANKVNWTRSIKNLRK